MTTEAAIAAAATALLARRQAGAETTIQWAGTAYVMARARQRAALAGQSVDLQRHEMSPEYSI